MRPDLLAPLPAIAVGVVIAASIAVAPLAFLPNAVGVVLGVLLVVGTRHLDGRAQRWLPLVAALLTSTTVLAGAAAAEFDGVHRWLALGPLQLHLSAALTPLLLLGVLSDVARDHRIGLAAVVVAQLVHVLQPDAGQATALAVALLPTTLRRRAANDLVV
ncbi:MAG TPA: hypothetical protein VGF99_13225, partial [Myxococcota bacterium]